MKRILICTGVLGGGTALVFAAAALAATLAPAGSLIPANTQQFGVLRAVSGPALGVNVREIAPDGGAMTQKGLSNNFGGLNVSAGPAVNTAVDLPAVAPVAGPPANVQPDGLEAP